MLLLLIGGCANHPKGQIAYERVTGWAWHDITGRQIETEHYIIYTTLTDDAQVQRFARVMEAAHTKYTELAPGVEKFDRQLPLFVFATYNEWARYTIATTGKDADAYLSVMNGGYAVKDQFVCWVSNETDALTTAAHEGFHQFVARHFRTRIPPTLEEGLASTFESVSVGKEAVTFDQVRNHRRQTALREAIDGDYLIPLETLVMIHAGDLRDRDPRLREGYYAQAWALAVMLRTDPTYRDATLNMLRVAASGNTTMEIGRNDGSQMYYPSRVKPFLQHYVAPDWARLEADYAKAIQQLSAKDEPLNNL